MKQRIFYVYTDEDHQRILRKQPSSPTGMITMMTGRDGVQSLIRRYVKVLVSEDVECMVRFKHYASGETLKVSFIKPKVKEDR